MTLQPSRRLFAILVAAVFALGTVLAVLLAYLVAELYLSHKGWLADLPAGHELAHLRMRNLLLIIGVPLMTATGFAVGWYGHAPVPAADDPAAPRTVDTPGADTPAGNPSPAPGTGGDSQ